MQTNSVAVGFSDLAPRFCELGKAADEMVEQLLPLAYGTATHGHGVALDGTYRTIDNLETILASAAEEVSTNELTADDEEIRTFIMAFSVYLGEVFKQEHQGEWLEVHYDHLGTSTLCVRSRTKRVVFIEPFTRIHKRIFDGAEFNVANYYRAASTIANAV